MPLHAIACLCNCIGIGHIFHNICPQCRELKMGHPWLQMNCFSLICTVWISKLQLLTEGFNRKSFFLRWTNPCLFKSPLSLKNLSHWLQGKGLSPEWIRSCTFNAHRWAKDLAHCLQSKGFSPVWILSCVLNVQRNLKVLGHQMHVNGFSPVCIVSCIELLKAICQVSSKTLVLTEIRSSSEQIGDHFQHCLSFVNTVANHSKKKETWTNMKWFTP